MLENITDLITHLSSSPNTSYCFDILSFAYYLRMGMLTRNVLEGASGEREKVGK